MSRLMGACQEPEYGPAGGGRWATLYAVAVAGRQCSTAHEERRF